MKTLRIILLAASFFAVARAEAATVTVVATDAHGKPAADAVISLAPADGAVVAPRTPEKNVIRQRDEMFIPLVVIVRRGGEVVFTNNDTTMHQVYSFSPIKQFEFVIDQGQISKPIVFDKAGVAAIGCNIHDQMIAYVYVADAPLAAVTDDQGRAEFRDVPPGQWRASFWHPQLPPGRPEPQSMLTVKDDAAQLGFSVPLLPKPDMKHMHMDY